LSAMLRVDDLARDLEGLVDFPLRDESDDRWGNQRPSL
jgi:hypothetical protein